MTKTERAIQAIKDHPTATRPEIMALTGVSARTVDVARKKIGGDRDYPSKEKILTSAQEAHLISMKKAGISYQKLAVELGMSHGTARKKHLQLLAKESESEPTRMSFNWPALSEYVKPVPVFAR